MKVTRFYCGKDGETHFEDVEVALKDSRIVARQLSETTQTKGMFFSLTQGDFFIDFHHAPRRQYIIILEGQVDVGIGDGTVRRFGQGDVLLVEDTTGRGHTTRSVNGQAIREIFVTLE
jgi:quercetin dioxygenase-like cupin family protein